MRIDMDKVHINLRGILREHAYLGILQMTYASDLPLSQAMEVLERVWQRHDVHALHWKGGAAASLIGPVLTVHGVHGRDQATEFLSSVAAGIVEEGGSGALRPVPRASTPVSSIDAELFGVVAGLCISGHSDPLRPTVWNAGAGVTERIIEAALDWCKLSGSESFVRVGMANLRCSADQRRDLLITGMSPELGTSITCSAPSGEIRNVAFGYEGTVYFGRLDPQGRWEAALSDLTQVVMALADDLQYAAIRRSRLEKQQWFSFLDHWWPARPYLEYGMAQGGRVLADTYVPDAFGVQLLGRNHKLPVLPEHWIISSVGSDSTLLRHSDSRVWFEGSPGTVPDERTLEQARNDLAPILLTDERAWEGHRQQFAQAPTPKLKLS